MVEAYKFNSTLHAESKNWGFDKKHSSFVVKAHFHTHLNLYGDPDNPSDDDYRSINKRSIRNFGKIIELPHYIYNKNGRKRYYSQ